MLQQNNILHILTQNSFQASFFQTDSSKFNVSFNSRWELFLSEFHAQNSNWRLLVGPDLPHREVTYQILKILNFNRKTTLRLLTSKWYLLHRSIGIGRYKDKKFSESWNTLYYLEKCDHFVYFNISFFLFQMKKTMYHHYSFQFFGVSIIVIIRLHTYFLSQQWINCEACSVWITFV